jgi:hypothetical protein
LIAGICLGVIIALIIIAVLVVRFVARRRNNAAAYEGSYRAAAAHVEGGGSPSRSGSNLAPRKRLSNQLWLNESEVAASAEASAKRRGSDEKSSMSMSTHTGLSMPVLAGAVADDTTPRGGRSDGRPNQSPRVGRRAGVSLLSGQEYLSPNQSGLDGQ